MDPETPGTQTSEFKAAVLSNIISVIAGAVALIHPGFHLNADVQAFVVTTALTVIGLVTSVYTFCRTHLKSTKLTTAGTGATTEIFAVNQRESSPGGQF